MTARIQKIVSALLPVTVGLLVVTLGATCVDAGQETVPQAPPGTERARLIDLHRDVSRLLEQAESADAATAGRVGTLRALATALEALGAAPSQAAAAESTASPPLLPDGVRDDLQRTARAAAAAASEPTLAAADIDTVALRELLRRVRTMLDGEIALGLTFQGSYSQTRAKEPAVGGHASAMGPAPGLPGAAAAGSPADATSSPVTFDERVQLPTRAWAGGPTKDHILESTGNGIALLDYDDDGWLDIYVLTAAQLTATRERIPHRNALYRNLGGWTFEDVSATAGVDAAAWGSGVCAGDADGDGRLDLYVTNWGPNFLFRNRGDGTFEEIATQAGVAADGWSTGCAFFDADGDGDLDLYVARYVQTTWDDLLNAQRTLTWRNGPKIMVGPAGLPGESDLFFENLGGGRFQEVSRERGLGDPARAYGFAVVTTDIDGDGFVDLFVANDSNPNFLYRNRGNGHFDSVGLIAGVAVNAEARAQAGMGADAGDADGDGRMDIVLTAFAHDRNTLYRNIDGELFEDATVAAGLAAPTFARMGWGVAFVDADLDGRNDLFIANGHIFADIGDHPQLGETFGQTNQLLLNTGTQFRDVSPTAGAGLQIAKVSRGLAIGDLDNDGDPDVVVSNMDDIPTVLENRQQTGHHWVGVRVTAPEGNRFAIGATVRLEAGGRTQVREIRSGGSYLSQSDLRVLFGLGEHEGPVSIEVRMPGGARWRWRDLPVDRYHALVLSPDARVTEAEADR